MSHNLNTTCKQRAKIYYPSWYNLLNSKPTVIHLCNYLATFHIKKYHRLVNIAFCGLENPHRDYKYIHCTLVLGFAAYIGTKNEHGFSEQGFINKLLHDITYIINNYLCYALL